jgi:hypothetical protein
LLPHIQLPVFEFNKPLDDPTSSNFSELESARLAKVNMWNIALKKVKKESKIITRARHWYYHHISASLDLANVLRAMATVCSALADVQRPTTPWQAPVLVAGSFRRLWLSKLIHF